MDETSADDTKSVISDEMDTGLLRRGDGLLPIVGLGASAGGIEALKQFFAAMPVDSGMAFVVVLHLSPTHVSTLAELFQHSTAMPVAAAADGMKVEANSVYVIPPGKFLSSVDGHLCLSDAHEPRGKRVAVDYFFRTLAETHGAQALAVVLSGMGADGALGLKRIKELGGLTIAQDPDEAEHPDMPRSAIDTGVVDWVLRVNEMPARLLAYVKQRAELQLPGEDGPHPAETLELSPGQHEAALREVLTFLHTRTGRDFSWYKRATIVRRVARRMQVNGLADLPAYLAYLRTHQGEAGALLQDLLISVTNFFRDTESFAALERSIPDLFAGKEANDTVRVWVAGCATGEEAYSIAILLCEHASTLVGPPQIQVFATDLDEEVIREAREGMYPDTIAADVSDERLCHYFIHEPGGYRVRRSVRELVLFAPHDLLKDSPFSRLDLVSCRNLLIYLKREAQSRAFDIFHFALRPGGRLFLGTSEAVQEGSKLFAVLDKTQRLYSKRPGPQRLITLSAGQSTLARTLALQDRMRERPTVPGQRNLQNVQTDLDQRVPPSVGLPPGDLHYRLIERFSPPSILVNSTHEIVHLSDSAGRFLQLTGGEPTRNLLRMVHPMLRVELRAALYAAAHTHAPAAASRVPFDTGDVRRVVDIGVMPAGDLAPEFLLVVFEEHEAGGVAVEAAARSADADHVALHLERELVSTKAHLRDTIEQSEASTEELKASNEELQAMNEELRSATEELEASREELQSINEELTTVNDELKSSVDRLARSNNDLQNLMAATDIATIFLDRELLIQRFTPSAKTLFNFIPADLGRPLTDLSRQLDYPEIVADAELSLAHLQPVQREVRAGEQWYLARTLPYRTADDHIAGVVLTFLNITAQKQAEEKIAGLAADSEQQRRVYETVLSNTPDFAYVFSLDHKVLYANDALIAMWGRGREGAIGKTFLEIGYEPWHAEMHSREIDQVRATRQPIRGEVPFNGIFGRRQYDYIFVPIFGADGEVEAVAGTTRDVTERKKSEKQLQDRQEQFDFALAAADLGQWSLNLSDRTARRTLRHDQLFGYDALLPDWTYEMFLQHVVQEDRAVVDEAFQKSVATGSAWSVECRIRRADGAVRHIWTKALIQRDAAGQVERMLGLVGDVTERRESEERQTFQVQLADALRPLSNPIEVQAQASRVLGERLGANRVVYFEIQGDDYVIDRDYTRGVQPLAGRYPVTSFGPALLAVLLDGGTVIEVDATTEPGRPPDERAAFAAIQVRGHVDVPLVKGGQFVAGMTVQVCNRRVWTPHEVALIEDAAERTWAAVERVRAEAALRQSEARLRLALSAARMVAWEYDPATGVVVTTDNATEVYGFPSGLKMASIDRGFALLHADDVQRHQATVERAVAAGEGFTSQFRIVRPDTGAVQWMEEWGHAVRKRADGAVQLFGVNMDISARKQAEEAFRQSEERLAFVRRSSGVGFWYCDLPFDVLDWDDLVKAHFHLAPDAVVTIQTFYDRIHPEDREPTRQAIDTSISERTAYNVDYRTVNPDTGDIKWVRAIGRTFYAADGSPTRFDGVTLDISEQKRAETILKESEQRFRLVADAAPVLIWVAGTDKLCNWFNQPWLAFTGRTMAQEVGHGWAEGVHPDDFDRCLQTYTDAFDARISFSMEYRLRRHDGEFRWLIDNGVPRFRSDGEFDGYIGSCLDVTEYKNAEVGLREADRRKDEFLATLAHELRNPLAPIRSGLQVIRMVGADPTIEQARAMMDRQLQQMTRLVDDLLDVSRLTTGKFELRTQLVHLQHVISAALETSRPVIEQQGHALEVVVPHQPIVVSGDAIRLAQVVSNLLNNSAKYTPRGGHIRVSVSLQHGPESAGAMAVVAVADNGIGIPPDMLGAVFGMFTQVDRALEKSTGGLGIGLSLVKGLVEMHGGTIEAFSKGEGKGSEFAVRLPITIDAVSEPNTDGARANSAEPAHPLRILIIDDNVDAANSLGQLLEIMGHEVRTSYDGQSGITAVEAFQPGVVLCDIGMPKMNGYDTARGIRAQEWGKTALLVALTGYGQESDLQRSADAGFDHHLVKPIEVDTLTALLDSFQMP